MPRGRDHHRSDRRGGGPRGERGEKAFIRRPRRKVCQFCAEKVDWVDYKVGGLLKKFISDRGKIRARRVTGTCAQHQRDVAAAIKNAREMALIPYAAR